MTWTSFHRRGAVLRAVVEAADERRDGRLPMDVAGVTETFDGEVDLLAALQLRWHTRLAGRIEAALAAQPMDLEAAVVQAWRGVAADMPGVRLVLDRHRAEPLDEAMARAIATSVAKERVMLAVTAGLAAVADELAAAVGARIEERARADRAPARPAAALAPGDGPGDGFGAGRGPQVRASLLGRLRAALAA